MTKFTAPAHAAQVPVGRTLHGVPGAGYPLHMLRPLQLCATAAVLLSACAPSHPVAPPPPDSTQTAAFLDTLEQRTFHYFWDLSNPANGLTPDRSAAGSFSSIAAVGFALTAYPIGVERGYVTRAAAAQRVLTTLQFFWSAPQDSGAAGVTGYKGFFYHFLDRN